MIADSESNVLAVDSTSFVEITVSTAKDDDFLKMLRKYANSFQLWLTEMDHDRRSDIHKCGDVSAPLQQLLYVRGNSTMSWMPVHGLSSAIEGVTSWTGPLPFFRRETPLQRSPS